MITPEQGSVLTGESVKLLVKGDVIEVLPKHKALLWNGGPRATVTGIDADGIDVDDGEDTNSFFFATAAGAFKFVSRPGNEDQGSSTTSIPVAAEGESAGQVDLVHELAMQLGKSIAGLGYPVGMGLAPSETECTKAAQGIVDTYGPMLALSHPVEADGQASGLTVAWRRRRRAEAYGIPGATAGAWTYTDDRPEIGASGAWAYDVEPLSLAGNASANTEGMETLQGRNKPNPHPETEARIASLEACLSEARKWIAGQPDRSTSIYDTSFTMLEAIDRLSPKGK